MWRHNPTSRDYDYRLINDRVRWIRDAREQGDIYRLLNLLRACMLRSLGNITSSKLFNCAFSGTKHLIEEYVQQYVEAVREIAALKPPERISGSTTAAATVGDTTVSEYEDVDVNAGGGGGGDLGGGDGVGVGAEGEEAAGPSGSSSPPKPRSPPPPYAAATARNGMASVRIPPQYKLDFLHDLRLGFGRTALVLQGGAIFGMCHLGVVKALLEQDLLPRVIVGTATGAMMAALVGVHPTEELLRILQGDGIDLSAFAARVDPDVHNGRWGMKAMWTWWDTLARRLRRFRKEGYFLDVKVLEECVRANIGDLTFEEAFDRSKRILNITVVPAGREGIPTLLNYITAPNVVRMTGPWSVGGCPY